MTSQISNSCISRNVCQHMQMMHNLLLADCTCIAAAPQVMGSWTEETDTCDKIVFVYAPVFAWCVMWCVYHDLLCV